MKAKPKRLTEEDLHVHLLPLARRFREAADPVDAAAMSAYMKGHFPFFGIKAPLRRALQKAHWVEVGLPDLEELPGLVRSAFAQPQREWHYAALDLLVKQEKKLGLRHLPLVEELITTKSWWDTVDSLAVHVAGGILRRHPQAAAEWSGRWAESDDLWLQRTGHPLPEPLEAACRSGPALRPHRSPRGQQGIFPSQGHRLVAARVGRHRSGGGAGLRAGPETLAPERAGGVA
jgi:hypothetical protein